MGMIIKIMSFSGDVVIPEQPFTEPADSTYVGEVVPTTWSITRQQDNTGSWNFTVPITARHADELKYYSRVYFMLDGVEMMWGLVDDVQITISDDKVSYNVSGLGEAGVLDHVLSCNYTHYYDTEVIVMLQEVLRWGGWRLGDYTSMVDPWYKSTIDCREQETVLQQIIRICESMPGLHWRFGGYNCKGYPLMDFGFFDEVHDVFLTQAEGAIVNTTADTKNGYITNASYTTSVSNLISEVHGNGGTYNLQSDPDKQRVMNLWHVNELFTLYPALEDPDYPLILDGNGFYRIRNAALYPTGGSARKTWDFVTTLNRAPPTASELRLAALGLYQRCIRFLQEHANTDSAYTLTATNLHTMVPPSDRVNVNADYIYYATEDGRHIHVAGENLNGDYRVNMWTMSGDKNDMLTHSVTVCEHEFVGVPFADEYEMVIVNRAVSLIIRGRASGEICGDYATSVDQDSYVDTAGPADPPDCIYCEDGIQIELDFGAGVWEASIDKVRLFGIVVDPPVEFDYEVIQEPDVNAGLPITPAIICFKFRDHPWDLTDQVTITSYFRLWG